MKNSELADLLRQRAAGSLDCQGCGYKHGCGARGCAILNTAADALGNSERHTAALQRMIENLRGQLEIRRCATCDYWQESDPRCMHPKSQYGGRTVALDNYCGYWHRHTDWIPVTERLPEVWRNSEKGELVNYMIYSPDFGVDIGNYHAKAQKWLCMGLPCMVTHWAPLPEPPEVGQ